MSSRCSTRSFEARARLCGGEYAIVARFDGELLHLAAQHNPHPGTADATASIFPHVPRRERSITARAFVDAAVVHVSDIETEELEPTALETYRRIMLRAAVCVPMVHEGRPIGVVSVSRGTPGPFSHREIDLLRTFADQAVIAIENVRLFKELETSNRDLTEALDQQTATSEILGVIASSPTMTPDGKPILGRVPGFDGLYVGSGCCVGGLSLSPAAGRALADLIVDGKSEPDLAPVSVERFGEGYRDGAALETACVAQYARRYLH